MTADSRISIRPRYEFKYLATVSRAEELLSRLSGELVSDPHATDGGYHVNSTYYDSDDFAFYYHRIDGVDPRLKIRIRYYGDHAPAPTAPDLPLFLEIKHRRDQTIRKDRIRLAGSFLREKESNRLVLSPGDVAQSDHPLVVETVRRRLLSRPVAAVCTVGYFRRAYLLRSNPSLRLTVDTRLRTTPALQSQVVPAEDGTVFLPPDLAVVEAKVHWSMPLWLLEALRESGLRARPYSKYGSAMECLFPERLARSVQYANDWIIRGEHG